MTAYTNRPIGVHEIMSVENVGAPYQRSDDTLERTASHRHFASCVD